MSTSAQQSFHPHYAALRSGCGIVELTNWSSVTLTGRDRQAFLHNFCTNDVKRLTPGTSCEAFFTNVKGKIFGHGLVTCRPDSLVIIGPPGQGEALAAHLDRYVIREDVVVGNTTADLVSILISGGIQARKLAASIGFLDAPAPRPDKPHWIEWNLLGTVYCGLVEVTGEAAPVYQALVEHGAVPCDAAAFETLRIEAGMPLLGVDFDEQNLPQEVGRDSHAISFTKGCYLGQETVARIDALGHVNQRVAGVRFSGRDVPEAGTELMSDGRIVGNVTSAAFSPRLGAPLALAMVRRGHNAVGSRLETRSGFCEVVALPV